MSKLKTYTLPLCLVFIEYCSTYFLCIKKIFIMKLVLLIINTFFIKNYNGFK